MLKMEPSEDISFMLFLGYQDYPTDENYVAKTQIPEENFPEGKIKTTCVATGYCAVELTVFWDFFTMLKNEMNTHTLSQKDCISSRHESQTDIIHVLKTNSSSQDFINL